MKTEKMVIDKVKKNLTELFEKKEIAEGKLLSEQLSKLSGEKVYLNNKVHPGFNCINFDKKTVFAHLNPGWDGNVEEFREDLLKFTNTEEYIKYYFESVQDYAHRRFVLDNPEKKIDNFDYKQALYLSGFPNNGIEFSAKDKDFHNKDMQIKNIVNVLNQELQLELIPYGSKTFKNLFGSQKKSDAIIKVIEPYFSEMLDIITLYDREYVIFGSNQYYNLLKSYNKLIEPIIINNSEIKKFNIGLGFKASFSMYKLKWNNKMLFAGIAHTFANQALPNAFHAMKKYGELSGKYYIDYKKKNF